MNSMNDSREFQEVESNHSERLSYVSSQPAMIPSSRSMLSRDKRLPLDNEYNFLRLIHTENHHQGIHPCAPQSAGESVPQATLSGTLFARDNKQSRDNSNADICKKAVDNEFYNTSGSSAKIYGWTGKKANFGTAIRQIHTSPIILSLEDTIQKSSDYLF